MAIEALVEALKRGRSALREKARFYNRRHLDDGGVSVRTLNTLRLCAKMTAAIMLLRNGGVA